MASSPLSVGSKVISYKTRSISLPTRSHPLILPTFNEHLSQERIEERLNSLEVLYNCVDYHFLMLTSTQQRSLRKWADEALDVYLGLLDVCATTKDVLSQSRHDLQQLLSNLRRRKDGYVSSGSKTKKAAQKSLKDLKVLKQKQALLAVDRDQETTATLRVSNEAEVVTMGVLQTLLLSYISGTTSSRPGNWSIVGKLIMNKKRKANFHNINDFLKVNGDPKTLFTMEKVKDELGKMETSIKGLEEGLDNMFRRLLKIRVSLLNILNN